MVPVGSGTCEFHEPNREVRAGQWSQSADDADALPRAGHGVALSPWQQRLTEIDAPWAPVFTQPSELLSAHATARGLFTQPHPDSSSPQARFPVTFGAGLDTFRQPAPALGEHTQDLLAELGSTEQQQGFGTRTAGRLPPHRAATGRLSSG